MPVAGAARQVLKLRLETVGERLKTARDQWDSDAEHVHQLRVSTRRAAAALKIFSNQLPDKCHKRLRRLLRRLRRAAGQARDWDVFLIHLMSRRSPAAQRQGLDFLLGFAQGQRHAIQEILLEATCNADVELARLQDLALAHLLGAAEQAGTLADLARPTFGELLSDFVTAAAEDLQPYEHLHRVRILGKRLRYSMEIFACCFPDTFRGWIYSAVEEMQEILGGANDSVVAVRRLEDLVPRLQKTEPKDWKRWRPGIEALLQHHQRRLVQQRKLFEKWWHKWHASGAEAMLRRMLTESGPEA